MLVYSRRRATPFLPALKDGVSRSFCMKYKQEFSICTQLTRLAKLAQKLAILSVCSLFLPSVANSSSLQNDHADEDYFFDDSPVVNLESFKENDESSDMNSRESFIKSQNSFDTYGFGARRDRWEKKKGVLKFQGGIDIFYRRDIMINNYLIGDFEASINKISPVLKEGIYFGTNNGKASRVGVKLQLGQLIALEEHVDSGFIFINYGIAGKIRVLSSFAWEFFFSSPSSYSELGMENKFWISQDEDYGFYLNFENYRPIGLETVFEGQTNYRVGVIFRY